MTDKIRIVIADDEKLIRTGLKIMLETMPDIEVVALAEDGEMAFRCCQEHLPDLVLMDIRMPHADGIVGTRKIKAAFPNIAVLIVTTFQDVAYIREAMSLGASGYLLKDSSYETIYDGIKVALSGKVIMDSTVSSALITESVQTETKALPVPLSEKEIVLIRCVAKGYNNREIAAQLFLSEGTVKNSISQLLSKLALRDRTQLAIFAYEYQLIADK